MASKTIKTILSLQDKNFSSGMSKASKGIGGFSNRLKHSGNQVKRFKKNTVRSFKSVVKSAAGLAVAYVGIRATAQGINESVEAAKAQLSVEKKLETVLKQRTNATDEQIKSIHDLAAAQQELAVVGDEIQMAGAQQVATFVKETESVETLLPAMNNLIAQQKGVNSTQKDAINIANMVGKVMNGQTGALTRVGISLSESQKQMIKHGDEQERAATLAQIITDNVGDMNKSLAELDEGKIKNMTNRWGDYKEEIGKKILPLQAEFAGWFATKIPGIQKTMLRTIDKITKGIDNFKDVGINAYNRVRGIIDRNIMTIRKAKDQFEKFGVSAVNTAIDVKNWFLDAFSNIRESIESNRPTIDGVIKVLLDLKEKAITVKDGMKEAFENAKPTINWLKDDGIPGVIDKLAFVIDKSTDLYNFVDENFPTIAKIVGNIGVAYGTWKLVGVIKTTAQLTKATYSLITAQAISKAETITIMALMAKDTIVQGINTGATYARVGAIMTYNSVAGIATMVTSGLSSAVTFLTTSALGPLALGIAGAIAVGVLLYKNWDTIKAKAFELWDGVKAAFEPLGEFFTTMFTSTEEGFKSFVNFFIDGINTVVEGMNKIKVNVPDWVPKIGGESWGVNIPKIPNFALGTRYFQGGLARINEGGRGEVVSLPNGSQVIPADKSERIIEKRLGNTNYFTININGVEMTIQKILNELIPQLKLALDNI